ncbi:MAG: gamma-glutamylcyclotransferase [Tissierellales bacterium]|nr:gamma-glutamylcyclotransferase [Tissierellales bacterium]
MLYFAYASNLSKKYMASRCPNALPLKKVVLKNYKLTFNELADIIPQEGEEVVGALYLISKQELEKLDILEGYPDLYDRITVELEDEFGNKYEALAYTMVEKNLQAPPDTYYNILVDGYKDWGIEIERLEKAKNFE